MNKKNLFPKNYDAKPSDLLKARTREAWGKTFMITQKFDRRLRSSAFEKRSKIQSNATI